MVKDVSELNGERWEGEKRVFNDVQGSELASLCPMSVSWAPAYRGWSNL